MKYQDKPKIKKNNIPYPKEYNLLIGFCWPVKYATAVIAAKGYKTLIPQNKNENERITQNRNLKSFVGLFR